MDVLMTPPPTPLRNVTHFFRQYILQALILSVVYKSIKVHLGKSQDLIMSIHYTENVNTLMKMLDFVYFV